MRHGKEFGLRQGQDMRNAKLSVDKVKEIRRLKQTGLTYPQIAVQFEVDPATIGKIVRRERWSHVE